MNDLVQLSAGHVSWHLLRDWQSVLLGPEGLRLEQWRTDGALTVVKMASHRAVYRVDLGNRVFYVKHYRCPRFWDVARHLFRACSAQREWRRAMEVARRGIATARPIGWGQRVRHGLVRDNYLVTEALANTCSLRQYVAERLPKLAPPHRQATRRRLVETLARFAAAIHQAGILHDDFHAGNILLDVETGAMDIDRGLPRLYLIDLAGVRIGAPLDWPASRDSLAVMSSDWSAHPILADRWRFWRTYLKCRPELALADRRMAAESVERHGREYARRLHRQRDKRSLRTNRDFVVIRRPGGQAHGVAEVNPSQLARWIEQSPDEWLWQNVDRAVKLGHSSVVVVADLELGGVSRRVALKRFRLRDWWKAFKGLFRHGRARRAWCAGHALLQRQIATPRPVALWEPRRPRWRNAGYVATEWIEGAENLHLWGWRLTSSPVGERLRQAARVAESLGRLIGRMHAFQIAHRDLKPSNVLVVQHGDRVETQLIDVDGIRIARRLSARQKTADLARLAAGIEAHRWVTRGICCRFVRAYVAQFPQGEVAWKSVWRDAARDASRMNRAKRRRRKQVL